MRPTIIKWILIIPAILFADWIVMIITGCLANACGASDHFYCTFYCKFSILLIISSILLGIWLVIKKNKRINSRL